MKQTEIVQHYMYGYVVMSPIYYENENKPAWRTMFKGTKEECENILNTFQNSYKATHEENKINRENKIQEYLFLKKIGKNKQAEKLKLQYKF